MEWDEGIVAATEIFGVAVAADFGFGICVAGFGAGIFCCAGNGCSAIGTFGGGAGRAGGFGAARFGAEWINLRNLAEEGCACESGSDGAGSYVHSAG